MTTLFLNLRKKLALLVTGCTAAVLVLTACSSTGTDKASNDHSGEVTVTNCGENITFPSPAEEIYVANNQILSMFFALNADDHISAVSGLSDGVKEQFSKIYGKERIVNLPFKAKDYPTLENVLSERPDAMMAGIGWGYNPENSVTPERLINKHNIAAYTLTTTCSQGSSDKKGIMPPWKAVFTDLSNIGRITSDTKRAEVVVDDIKNRHDNLKSASTGDKKPTVFFYDITVKEGVLAGGSLSAGHAIIEAAGGMNALDDIKEELTTVSWEHITKTQPDVFLISDYGKGPYSYDGKINDLKTNPATKDLEAVKNDRFIRLPAPMLLGTPLMIDAAEHLRKALEDVGLVPESSIEPQLELD